MKWEKDPHRRSSILSIDTEQETAESKLVKKWERSFRRGSLRFFILHLLLYQKRSKHDSLNHFHGYHLAQSIEEMTQEKWKEKWKPTTASIYPILKELSEEKVIEKLPDTDSPEKGRGIKKYRLTPFGIRVAEMVEESRKEFGKAFIVARAKALHLPFSRLLNESSEAELSEIFDKIDLNVLESHRDHLKEKIKDMNDTFTLINRHIEKRMNKS